MLRLGEQGTAEVPHLLDLEGRERRLLTCFNNCRTFTTAQTFFSPIKPVALRSNGGGVTIIANPKNARYLRIDNVVPGTIKIWRGTMEMLPVLS